MRGYSWVIYCLQMCSRCYWGKLALKDSTYLGKESQMLWTTLCDTWHFLVGINRGEMWVICALPGTTSYIHRCDLKYNLNKTKFPFLHRILTLAYTRVQKVQVMAIRWNSGFHLPVDYQSRVPTLPCTYSNIPHSWILQIRRWSLTYSLLAKKH